MPPVPLLVATWIPLAALNGVLIAGVALLVLGLRGRRVDDQPVCRSCRFDLRGSVATEASRADAVACPECGTRARPAIGNRRRRPVWIVAGLVLSLAAVAGTAAVTLSSFKPPLKFFAHLRLETRPWFAGDEAGDAALDELVRRWRAGDLSTAQQDRLAEDAVSLGPAGRPHQDRERAARWDQVSALALREGRGTRDERIALVRSWLTYTLKVRSQVGRGQDLRVGLAERVAGLDGSFGFYIHRAPVRLTVAGKTAALLRENRSTNYATRGSHSTGVPSKIFEVDSPLLADLAVGPHPMEATFGVSLIDEYGGATLLTWNERPTAMLNLVADPTPIGRIDNAELAERVLDGVSVRGGTIRRGGPEPRVKLYFGVTAPMAYWIYAEHGDQRWRLGSIVDAGEGGALQTSVSFEEPALFLSAGAKVRLVFEPSFELARRTFNLTEILDRSFAIEEVPVVDGPLAP